MARINTIEGIGPAYQAKLKEAGVKSVEHLLELCATKKGRLGLIEKTGLSDKLVLKWANHADLFRIKGIGGQYAELLEAAGVDTVPELAQRRADNLFKKINEINEEKKLVRKLPTAKQVENWVVQAGTLPRMIQH